MKKLINKRIIFYFILISSISILLNMGMIQYSYFKYDQELNRTLNRIIGEVIVQYPSVDEEDLIDILNSKEDKEVLQKYGINTNTILKNKSYLKNHMIQFMIMNLITFILIFGLYIIYVYKQNKKIKDITKYLQRINQHDYTLEVEQIEEGELSILQNELYKITVMLKEQALHSIQDKETLKRGMSDISHQLKTPLTSISIMVDNMIDNPNMDEIIRKDFLRDIRMQIKNINLLVITLLKLSRFDADVVEMKQEHIHVKTLLNKVINNLNILIDLKNIQVNMDVSDIELIGDFFWEEEALTNIIKNAIEHSNPNGTLTITCCDYPFYTKLIIQDHGEGIEKEELKNIFKRFYKGKSSHNDSFGIGLNLAKTIIEKDHGYIHVTSKLKEGTTFIIKYMKKWNTK